jgi:hypothetical protein
MYSCDGGRCFQYPCGTYHHESECVDMHERRTTSSFDDPPNCKWIELKLACARWNQPEVLSRAIAKYPRLHREHPLGRDVFYNAMIGNSIDFIHSHIDTYEHGNGDLFQWGSLDAITSYVRTHTRKETLETLHMYGAAINPGCYDLALSIDNTPIADWCEMIATHCWCGKRSDSMFGECNEHNRKLVLAQMGGEYPPYRDSLLSGQTIRLIIQSANIPLLERKFQVIEPFSLKFLPSVWLTNDLPAQWFETIIILHKRGFNIRDGRFERIYLVAAGYIGADTTYTLAREPNLAAIDYFVRAGLPTSPLIRRVIMYSRKDIFDILKPTASIREIDTEIAAYGSEELISQYEFTTDLKKILSKLVERGFYSLMKPLLDRACAHDFAPE